MTLCQRIERVSTGECVESVDCIRVERVRKRLVWWESCGITGGTWSCCRGARTRACRHDGCGEALISETKD